MENSEGDIFHVEPVEHLHYLIMTQMRGLMEMFRTENYAVYLQGDGNFREELAVTKPYKGARTKAKPIYYQQCRDYLISEYDAQIVDGYETDDQVCMRQQMCMEAGIPSVIVSPDKDLKNMVGYNYNPQKKIFSHVTPEMAERHMWTQMVVGDSVDNIAGIYRVGPAWVKKHDHLDNVEFKAAVIDVYMQKHDATYMQEQWNLLHMCRWADEVGGNCSPDYYDFGVGYEEPKPIEYHPEEET